MYLFQQNKCMPIRKPKDKHDQGSLIALPAAAPSPSLPGDSVGEVTARSGSAAGRTNTVISPAAAPLPAALAAAAESAPPPRRTETVMSPPGKERGGTRARLPASMHAHSHTRIYTPHARGDLVFYRFVPDWVHDAHIPDACMHVVCMHTYMHVCVHEDMHTARSTPAR